MGVTFAFRQSSGIIDEESDLLKMAVRTGAILCAKSKGAWEDVVWVCDFVWV